MNFSDVYDEVHIKSNEDEQGEEEKGSKEYPECEDDESDDDIVGPVVVQIGQTSLPNPALGWHLEGCEEVTPVTCLTMESVFKIPDA